MQHRFMRMLLGLKGLEYGGRLERLKLQTLEERRNRTDLVELFKISKGLSAIPWNLFIRTDNSERTRGRSKKLVKEGFRLNIREFFSHKGSSTLNRCNGLSEEEVVSAGTVDSSPRSTQKLL